MLLQVGQSFVKGLNDAMAPCVNALPQGASVTQCCSIVQGVSALPMHLFFSPALSLLFLGGEVPKRRLHKMTAAVCLQTLQNANSMGEQAGTSSVFNSALDSYPNVKACQTTSTSSVSTATLSSAASSTGGR